MVNNFKGVQVGDNVPVEGKWSVGDFILNSNHDNPFNIQGWVCTKSGEPGSWSALTQNGYLVCSRLLIDKNIKVLVELISKGIHDYEFEIHASVKVMGYKFKEMLYQAPVSLSEAIKDFDIICESMVQQGKAEFIK